MTYWLRWLFDAVFPAGCGGCDTLLPPAHLSGLCATCRALMSPPPPPLCLTCGLPLGTSDRPCPGCRRRPPAFTTARASALYLPSLTGLNPLATAVRRLKYERRRAIAEALGELLAERYPFAPDALLVPVPLHRARLRARGFNQALLLARALGRRRGLAVAGTALVRIRPTPAQTGRSAAARRVNLSAAFAAPDAGSLRGRPVVLVDDVLTTGATADACARVLLAAGAERVDVYTVGRVP